MDLEPIQLPVCAICGENPLLPPGRVGCGQPIFTCAEVYRCTECQTPFHRECAIRHFGDPEAPEYQPGVPSEKS